MTVHCSNELNQNKRSSNTLASNQGVAQLVVILSFANAPISIRGEIHRDSWWWLSCGLVSGKKDELWAGSSFKFKEIIDQRSEKIYAGETAMRAEYELLFQLKFHS